MPISSPMKPIVQISLDLTSIDEALETAALVLRAGVDWLEAGTPLILAEGLHGVRALRKAFPGTPIVADLKTMDGGYLEAEMMAKAGATHVVVMARAHAETIKCVVKACRDFGCKVMVDNMICEDMVAGAMILEDLGCYYVIHHSGYDERRGIAAAGHRMPSPLDQLREVVNAVKIPVQAVGGLTLEQAIQCPQCGAALVVRGAPWTIGAGPVRADPCWEAIPARCPFPQPALTSRLLVSSGPLSAPFSIWLGWVLKARCARGPASSWTW